MRFFKFIGPDNMSLTKEYDKILYKKGETIVVENAAVEFIVLLLIQLKLITITFYLAQMLQF